MALITTSELEAFMGKTFTTEEEAQASSIIDTVSDFIESEVGMSFSPVVDDVITIQADGQGIIEFTSRPVADVTSVKDVNGDEITDWEFDGLSAVYNLFPNQVVTVTYSHGSLPPNDIKGIAKTASARVMYNPSGLRQETVGAISVTYPGIGGEAGTINFSATERKILAKYGAQSSSLRLNVTKRRLAELPILTLTNDIP